MKRTFLSTFMMWTWAAWNGFGAWTAPDSDAIPASDSVSAAPVGSTNVVTATQIRPRAIRTAAAASLCGVRMDLLLSGESRLPRSL